ARSRQGEADALRRHPGLGVQVGDLLERVHPGVRAAGPVQLEVAPAGHHPHRGLDLALDRPGVLLDLPAAVPRARVFDPELEARHFRRRTVAPAAAAVNAGPTTRRPLIRTS